MKLLDKRTASDATKLAIFIVVTTVATAMLAITIGNLSFGSTKEFKAVFTDATGVTSGDDIRVAGVKVGNVSGVEVVNRTQARVTFKVKSDTPVSVGTIATIRYRNLVGQRYIALTQGLGGTASMKDGDTIPLARTTPALDLSVLFNGFKPLFQALSPADINKLAYELIQVFQGEGGTLDGLLRRTASVTNTLADRDDVIGALISNLNETLKTLGDRDEQLSSLVVQLRRFVGGLSQDREAILGSLDQISALAVQAADLVTGIRPGLTADIKHLRVAAGNIDRNKAEVDRALKVMPIKLEKVGRTAIYGSWFNFYLCDFKARIRLPGGTTLPVNYSVGGRCNGG
jgi:phospholipid/cholesterol/gamma-HCH transport system substrate-binding protein